jgi:hypothetical protein
VHMMYKIPTQGAKKLQDWGKRGNPNFIFRY